MKSVRRSRGNVVIVLIIALCFAVTLIFCFIYNGKGFLNVAFLRSADTENFYAVTTGGYDDMLLARTSAELIKERGGAGCVVKGDKIEIIYAVYRSKSDAESVIAKSGEKGTYVKEIAVSKSKLKWADKEMKASVSAALKYFDLAFDVLYNLSNSLYDKSKTVEDAKIEISVLHGQIDDIKSVFYQNTASSDASEITDVKLALITALALLDNIEFMGTLSECTASIRYALVQLTFCYQSLMSSI